MPRTMTPSSRARATALARRAWAAVVQLRLAAARQQVERADQLLAAHLADGRMAGQRAQLLLEVRADVVAHALDQPLASR